MHRILALLALLVAVPLCGDELPYWARSPGWIQPWSWAQPPGWLQTWYTRPAYVQPLDWTQTWYTSPAYGDAVSLGEVNVVYLEESSMRNLFKEAEVTGFVPVHPYSYLGIKWARLYRADLSYLTDPAYRAELVDWLVTARKYQTRRAQLAARRNGE